MKRLTTAVLLAVCWCVLSVGVRGDEGFSPIFDGRTLQGWDGNPEYWSVQDGAITGRTTADKPLPENTFLIWRGGEVGDFELKLEYKISGGNSGIQYRSFEVEGKKWVVGGYQADIDATGRFTGILYGERYRGILARRGEKTVIREGGKPEVVGSVGNADDILAKIKPDDWNEYHIIAKGNHFIQKINGVVTCEVTDEDSARRQTGIVALQLHRGPPMVVQFRNIRLKRLGNDAKQAGTAKKKVVFIAGPKSHGYGAHEHNAGCLLLADHLKRAMPGFETVVFQNGWPEDDSALDNADALVMFCDGGGRHIAMPHLERIDQLFRKGMGVACLHYAVEVPKDPAGEYFLRWIGGYFEINWSVNPHWQAKFKTFPSHPVARGLKPFESDDEWYYHMRFRNGMEGVTPILSDLPPAETLKRRDGPHSNNPHVREAVLDRHEPQHVAWVSESDQGGRGFGFTGGHWHWNWANDNFRRVVLNGIVWIAGADVPEGGTPLLDVTMEDLEKHQDYEPPKNFDRKAIQERFGL